MRCVFCGCTERRACLVRLEDQPPSIRQLIEASAWPSAPPAESGCAWIQHDPPVCSAPACVKKWNAELTAASSTHSRP
jgi:hypothetical protein